MTRVATVILAGGQGTRLHPLTIHHSKPAVSYGGRYKLIDIPISNSINSDFRQIFILAQHLAGELQHHVSQTYHFDSFKPGSIDVLTPQQNEKGEQVWFEGNADAVRKNLSTLMGTNADYFLILSGDQLYNMNFQPMIQFAKMHQADLTIASIPITRKDADRMGLLRIDQNHKIIDFVEKPKDDALIDTYRLESSFFSDCKIQANKNPMYLASMGIYVFKREALQSILTTDPRSDFGHHIIHTAVEMGKAYSFVFHGYWEDIGTVASYYEANLALTKGEANLNTYDEKNPIYACPVNLPGPRVESTQVINSILSEGCIIEAAQIIHSVVGIRCKIGRGTVLKDCVLIGNESYRSFDHNKYSIGEDCIIEKTIIDEKVKIGNRVKLINQQKLDHFDGNGIFIRDGIIIVTAETILPDDFIL